VVVAAAGTADLPVAEEAAVSADFLGNEVDRLYDVGVAGLHRLLAVHERLTRARVVIVVAGMEGALPSVVGGLVDVPVIAVPTSVGYGASFGGVTALLAMLNSCASGRLGGEHRQRLRRRRRRERHQSPALEPRRAAPPPCRSGPVPLLTITPGALYLQAPPLPNPWVIVIDCSAVSDPSHVPMQPGALRSLEFDRIVDAVSRLAQTPLGAARLAGMRPLDRSEGRGAGAGRHQRDRPLSSMTARLRCARRPNSTTSWAR
jgi:hypothetical protein